MTRTQATRRYCIPTSPHGASFTGSDMATILPKGTVYRVTLQPHTSMVLYKRAIEAGKTPNEYIVSAINEKLDRDLFAEIDAEGDAE